MWYLFNEYLLRLKYFILIFGKFIKFFKCDVNFKKILLVLIWFNLEKNLIMLFFRWFKVGIFDFVKYCILFIRWIICDYDKFNFFV